MSALARLGRRATSTGLSQAARLVELASRRGAKGPAREIGGDTPAPEEPLHFIASDRMTLPANDLASITGDGDEQVRITANVLGLAGATPALPPFYSEIQLQRRRLRDKSFAAFLNVFDHRALSFFYRAFRKYNWLVAFEREPKTGDDPVTHALLALAGFATPASRARLSFDDGTLVPLAGRLGDMRRSAAGLETALRHITRLPLRVVEAEPTWMALPEAEQTRLGSPGGLSRLGGEDPISGLGFLDAAVVGAAVLDVQHHYAVEIGPLAYDELLEFCQAGGMLRMVDEICRLAAGMEHRPVVRLAIVAGDVPPLQLAADGAPAILGRTTWMGMLGDPARVLADCAIPIGAIALPAGESH